MSEKNICQNPLCCMRDSVDRWNKKINEYQSRKAYFKPRNHYSSPILEYFCTSGCANQWLANNVREIFETHQSFTKILEKLIRS